MSETFKRMIDSRHLKIIKRLRHLGRRGNDALYRLGKKQSLCVSQRNPTFANFRVALFVPVGLHLLNEHENISYKYFKYL